MLEIDASVKVIQYVVIKAYQANKTVFSIPGTVFIRPHVSIVSAGDLSKGMPVKGAIGTGNKGKPSH